MAPKYRMLDPAFVHTLAACEATKHGRTKELVKAVKRKLHQVVAAYGDGPPPYEDWLACLRAASTDQIKPVCTRILAAHASTRERLSELDGFYATLLDGVSAPNSVLDLACGLNPMTRPWMPLPTATSYTALDVDTAAVRFLNLAFQALGYAGTADIADLAFAPPVLRADLVLLLKAVPCLEQLDKTAGRRLLETIQANCVLVSYPVASLGGRRKGMADFYDRHFQALVAGLPWRVERFTFYSELVFRLHPE